MSTADALIAGLQADASFDSAGGFSLDRAKARAKLRQFQLADPHRYVLLLVEAATLKGATVINFTIDADDMRMSFDAGLDWEDLDELYTSLFVDRSTVQIRARRELALACNAAMALNPRWLRIESWTPAGAAPTGVRAILQVDAQDLIEPIEAGSGPGSGSGPWTDIHVKDRFRPGLLVRFLYKLGDALPEAQLIRDRCRHAAIVITLDGQRISAGLPSELLAAVEFASEGLRGVAGLRDPAGLSPKRTSGLVLLSNGVELSTITLNDSVPGLWFWVDASSLRKDVSQADVVRNDPSYIELLAVLARARDQVLARLVELWRARAFTDETTPSASAVFELLRRSFLRWADSAWLHPEAGPLGQISSLPLWRTVDQRWLSPQELLAEASLADPKQGRVGYTQRDFNGVLPLDFGPVIHVNDRPWEIAAIERVYPERAQDVSAQLEREVPWELNRRKWRATPHSSELPPGVWFEPIRFAGAGFVGQIAMRAHHRSAVRIVVDGCLLHELDLELGVFGVSAVLSGPMQPSQDYASVLRTNIFAQGVHLLLAQLPALISAWAEAGAGDRALRLSLAAILHPDFPRTWFEAFGFDPREAREQLGRLGTPALLPELGLDSGAPTGLAQLLRFSTVDQRTVSLAQIDQDRRRRQPGQIPGKVYYVKASDQFVVAGPSEELCLYLDEDEHRLLLAAFGREAIHDLTQAYLRDAGRRRFLAKPRVGPWDPGEMWSATIDGPLAGVVAIDPQALRGWDPSAARLAEVDIVVEQRVLTTLELRAWLPGVRASLGWDQAPVNSSWDGLEGSLEPVLRALSAGLSSTLRAHAEAAIQADARPAEAVRRLLWLAMATPFISVEHAAAWRRFRAAHPFPAAVAAYCELLELFPQIPIADLCEGISLVLDDGKLPTGAALRSILMAKHEPPRGGHEFQRAVLELYETLERVPLLTRSSGAAISLATLTQHYLATGEVAYVQDLSLSFDSDHYLIVRADTIDHTALIRLFGQDACKEVSAWIHERRHQQRFESQAALSEIRVPEHNRLVAVQFEREGVRGELAIPPWMPGKGGVMKLTVCHELRVVEEIELHAALPVLGIIDDPELELSPDYAQVNTRSPRMAKLRELLDGLIANELLMALAAAYPDLPARHQGLLARAWIAEHWRRFSPLAGVHPNRLSAAGRELAALPLFRDTDGSPRSLTELSQRYAAQQRLWFVDRDPGPGFAPPFPVVLRRARDRELLAALFDGLEDFSARWKAMARGQQRRERAPALPELPAAPKQALVVVAVDRHGLRGQLWLPDRCPFDAGVSLGAGGRVLAVSNPSELLPAQGVVGGLEADDLFERPIFSAGQARYLEARVISLYGALLLHHQVDLARPDQPYFLAPEAARLRALRLEFLRRVALELARAARHGRRFDAILGNLVRRLELEPLLRLASGRLISIDLARQVRAQEHAHLDIWDPHSPALHIHERERLLRGEEPEPEPPPEPDHAEPEPPSEPEPPPKPVGDPNDVVLERVREELRLLRDQHEVRLSEGQLDGVRAARRNGRILVRIEDGVIFDCTHPSFIRATLDPDPIWISFLASVAYTALNHWLADITDDHELEFHQRHAEHLLSGLL